MHKICDICYKMYAAISFTTVCIMQSIISKILDCSTITKVFVYTVKIKSEIRLLI